VPAVALSAVVATAVGTRGPATANLQALLARIDLGVLPRAEVAAAAYGPARSGWWPFCRSGLV
jgi:hypothetical protein